MQPFVKQQVKHTVLQILEKRPHWVAEFLRQHPGFAKPTLRAHPEWIREYMQENPGLAEQLLEERIRRRYQLPVQLDSYQSPLPDIPAVKRNLARWYRPANLDPAQWSLDKQSQLLEMLCPYKSEADALPNAVQIAAAGYGLGYGEVEARLLYMMVRYLKPRRVLEVGAGVSTFYTQSALERNGTDGSAGTVLCIEPYPTEKLKELDQQGRITLEPKQVQDVPIEVFQTLGANDVLFIDSSHVSKIDSDVNWLYLDVLPQLKPGVVIQIHDIHFPYLTVQPNHPLFDLGLLWNEAALVQAFLQDNHASEVLLCESQVHHERPAALKSLVSIYEPEEHAPSSLWLRRVETDGMASLDISAHK